MTAAAPADVPLPWPSAPQQGQVAASEPSPGLPKRGIHLLYVPTLNCNLSCTYCYLGEQTTTASLLADARQAEATLDHTLAALEAAGVLAFNVSLHGGEVTTLPEKVLDGLFTRIRDHYRRHFDALNALGHRKSEPHIKTNLFRFAPLLPLFLRHRVSISASIDLPLSLHARYRRTRGGDEWMARTLENLRLLAAYPHAKKISLTLSAEHVADLPALVADIWFLHREIGLNMNTMNLMFAFPSALNAEFCQTRGEGALTPMTEAQQLAVYEALHREFMGTELEEGLRRHWFDEFKPGYCTNCVNCGERFYLLQGDGSVYSCVRGQGIEAFRYGNVFHDPILQILDEGSRRIGTVHGAQGFDPACQTCAHLAQCHTGCAVVKQQMGSGRSYTCALQRRIYQDNPLSYPATPAADQADYARAYAATHHPRLAIELPEPAPAPRLQLPNDLSETHHALLTLIADDPLLQQLYRADAWVLEWSPGGGEDAREHAAEDAEFIPLESQILRRRTHWHTVMEGDRLRLHLRREILEAACDEPLRNSLHLQMLRDTAVVYGDEKRSKQAHLYTYQLYRDCLEDSVLGPEWAMADLGGLIALHRRLYQRGVRNNLLVTTAYLRDYHYQKQKANAYYHIQAINLPFQNFEFHYLSQDQGA